MTAREYLLLVDDDQTITEGLSMLLERPGRTTIVCSDVESAEITLARFPVTHLVSDVQFSGPFGYEGLQFLGRVREKLPQCRIVLITGQSSDALRMTAITSGANSMLAKPFDIDELEAAIGSGPEDPEADPYAVIRVPSLDQILGERTLEIAFQPIVRIERDGVSSFAFEALSRLRGSWPGGGADTLFDYAARRGRLAELNLHALRRAIETTSELPPSAYIFINLDPTAFTHGDLMRVIASAARRAELPLDRIVLEVTERSAFAHPEAVAPLFHELRQAGVRFALDDHGSAYSHLSIINSLRPAFVKISSTFGIALEGDKTRQSIVAHVAAMAHDLGCETVLEGIETGATARIAADLGIHYAQGYHFGRPHGAGHWLALSKSNRNAA